MQECDQGIRVASHRRLLDFSLGGGSFPMTLETEALWQSVLDQFCSGSVFYHPTLREIETAELLKQLLPDIERVRFGPSRSEANLAAMRVARAVTGKNGIVRVQGQDLGWYNNLGPGIQSTCETRDWVGLRRIPPREGQTSNETCHLWEVEWGDLMWLERLFQQHSAEIAGVILQPLHHKLLPPANGYFSCLRGLCDRFGVLLILDDTQHGFHLGPRASIGELGVDPDLLTLSFSPRTGLNTSVLCGKKGILENWKNLGVLFQGAHHGNAVGVSGVRTALNLLLEDSGSWFNRIRSMAAALADRIESVEGYKEGGGEVRCRGGLVALDLPASIDSQFWMEMEKLLVRIPDDCVLRILDPHTMGDIDELAKRIGSALEQCRVPSEPKKNAKSFSTNHSVEKGATGRSLLRHFRFTHVDTPDSPSERFREKRFASLLEVCERFPKPVRIVDFGGTSDYWSNRGLANSSEFEITLINLAPQPVNGTRLHFRMGDVNDLSDLEDRSFDVAACHSVIEHLYTRERQVELAKNLRRIAKAYWVQTPNYGFPIEPHFLLPGFQWLPESVRVRILKNFGSLRTGPIRDNAMCLQAVREIRLLSRNELNSLFPEGRVVAERYLGMVKSWVVSGFAESGWKDL